MDVQSAMPPAASAPSASVVGVPPQIGTPVPGSSGGLPALQGLSVTQNPMAEQLRSQGRGDDTMLVHMTPNEVNSLQGLAVAHGGSLTINPETGLPEAGWLGKLLPTILGGVLAATGVGAPLAAGIVGLGQTALTGDLKKGLMAGLGAFGGASLAGAAGLGGAISKNAFGVLGDKAGLLGANMGAGAALTAPIDAGAAAAAEQVAQNLPGIPGMTTSVPSVGGGSAGFLTKFGQTATAGLPGGIISKAAPFLAAQGLIGGVSNAFSPSGGAQTITGQIDNSYQGPYFAQDRRRITDPEGPVTSKQRRHFAVSMPEIYNTTGQLVQPGSMTPQGTPVLQPVARSNPKKGENLYDFQYVNYMGGPAPSEEQMAAMYPGIYGQGYNEGGEVKLAPGSFIVDARTVSESGEGDGEAGKNAFRKLGGIPIEGPGDGVSDSIPARIGNQPARVATGEVYMPPEAVRRIGKGDEKRGAQKLYAMMDRAHQATKRGQKRNILKGLA